VTQWLKEQAMALVGSRVPEYAARIGRPDPDVRLSNARNEWGQAATRAG
jgi:predicted metal-dependent hydrolase